MSDAIIELSDRVVLVEVGGAPGAKGDTGNTGAISGASEVVITPNALDGGGNAAQTVLSIAANAGANNPVQAAILRSTNNIAGKTNFVFGLGLNVNGSYTLIDNALHGVSERLEYLFEQDGVDVSEGVGELVHAGGDVYRWRYDLFPVDAADRATSLCQRNADRHIWGNFAAGTDAAVEGDVLMRLSVSETALTLKSGYRIVFPANNAAVVLQHNAAEDTLLEHPYINAADKYQINQPVVTTGGADIGGSVNIGGVGDIALTVANATKAVGVRSNNGGTATPTIGTDTNDPIGIQTNATTRVLIGAAGEITLSPTPPEHADDAAASAGGLGVGRLYRTGSVLKVRVA